MANPDNTGGASFIERAKEYYVDLKAEMRRVTWPTKDQVISTTAVVLITVFAFSAYFFLIDLLMGQAVTKIFDLFGVGRS
jgi:preprotein translocase subunit SecE